MKTTAILVAAAAAFLFASGPAFTAETEASQTQTKAKQCYRTFHKQAFRTKVPCRKVVDTRTQPMKPVSTEPKPQPAPEKKP